MIKRLIFAFLVVYFSFSSLVITRLISQEEYTTEFLARDIILSIFIALLVAYLMPAVQKYLVEKKSNE